MKSPTIASQATAFLLLLASIAEAKHVRHFPELGLKHHHKHRHVELGSNAPVDGPGLEKRGGQCEFPSDSGLVAVTPNEQNAGWAMSPDQPCTPGNYCPFACPPGEVMAQWDPDATSYSYPASMNGGLYCDENGEIQKPFPSKPYCMEAKGPLAVKNEAGGHVAFCQTVLPGNEAMLIPTSVTDYAELAVPGPDYWCETAAHYYINPPGKSCDTACVWGTKDNPWGNWSPYVAGANMDSNGQTFVKLGWNPIYLEPATPFREESPSFGVKIECEGGGCNGLPCAIDPKVNGVNEMTGSATDGAGGGAFCVVTVPKGSTANIVVFNIDGSGGEDEPESPPAYSAKPIPSSSAPPPPPSTTSTPTPEPTTSIPKYTVATSSPESSTTVARTPTVSPHVFAESATSTATSTATSEPSSAIGSSGLPPTYGSPEPSDSPHPGAASTAALSIMSLTCSFLIVSIMLNF
ncbi:hypothetical protein FQN55_001346 [Onygenales sp. PD_40]|nr:hypothetical protein FQN55_001346 [Onygenales sp. PD_40]KAK2786643.1 hypothetical protein FQN53_006347 [Emmonsiellopsis sp. PD_33]KAK2801555.1 hypothetical protein FQN51_005262 [Onygenales sp. PD_10]